MKRKNDFNLTGGMIICLYLLVAVSTVAAAEEIRERSTGMASKTGWSVFTRGGYVYQMDTDIDNGGSFSVNRFFVQGGPTYVSDGGTSISLAVGYGFDGYDFSGDTGFGSLNPGRISTPSASVSRCAGKSMNSGRDSSLPRYGLRGKRGPISMIP